MGSQRGSVLKETIAVSATISISVKKQHSRIRLRVLSCNIMREMRREPEVPEGKSPSGRMFRLPCKDYLKGTCTNSFCEKWHPPECVLYKSESGCRCWEKCSYAHRQVEEQPSKRSKKNGDKSAVAMLKKKKNEHHQRTGRSRSGLFSRISTREFSGGVGDAAAGRGTDSNSVAVAVA